MKARKIKKVTSFREKRSLRSQNRKRSAQAHSAKRPLGANSEIGTATTRPLRDFEKRETARGLNNPSGFNQSEYKHCTAHRDEKKTSLPRHTAQLSRNMQSGDTNSATAYRSNTKRTGVSDRRGRKKGKAKNESRKGSKSCANA